MRLAQLGRRIEAHFWLPPGHRMVPGRRWLPDVQSRPITTLFPIPETGERENHVYVSVGHQQMMTDPIPAPGLSVWQRPLPARWPRREGGSSSTSPRVWLHPQVARASWVSWREILSAHPRSASDRPRSRRLHSVSPRSGSRLGAARRGFRRDRDRSCDCGKPDRASEASIAALQRDIQTKSGSALLDFIVASIDEQKRIQIDSQSLQVIMAGIEATWWLNDHLQAWLGEKNAADTLAQSARTTSRRRWASRSSTSRT